MVIAVLLMVIAGACRREGKKEANGSGEGPLTLAPPPRGDAARGLALIERFECNRCHEGAFMAPVAQSKHCFQCHRDIMAGKFEAPAEVMPAWRARVRRLIAAPSLVKSEKHYRRDWLEKFLLEPYDLRPHLDPTMPRLAITAEEARDIATAIAPSDEPTLARIAGADADRGAKLLNEKGCGSCHLFTGAAPLADKPAVPPAVLGKSGEVDKGAPAIGVMLAPDLRVTRDRLRPDGLAAWLMDPAAVKPGTAMPSASLREDEARDIAAYLLTAPLDALKVADLPARLPVLDREVTFDEVSERVLRKTCWHCHGEPDYAHGEGGPGNTGGFGFRGRELSLADYDGVASGMVNDRGERESILTPGPDGMTSLVRALVARQEEERGRPMSGVRGMPLGLPSLSAEEIQLVETWIAKGRRQ